MSQTEPEWVTTWFEGDFGHDYLHSINTLWLETVKFNQNVFILERIEQFPAIFFDDPHPPWFWNYCTLAMFESCILTGWKLLRDKDKRVMTMPKLRQRIEKNLKSREARHRLDQLWADVDIDEVMRGVEPLLKRMERIRNTVIAHLNEKVAARGLGLFGEDALSLDDLRVMRDKLNTLFSALCLDMQKAVLVTDYDPKVSRSHDRDTRPDIDKLLDLVARDSEILNMPERQPAFWKTYREMTLGSDDIKNINLYRQKFGMSPVE